MKEIINQLLEKMQEKVIIHKYDYKETTSNVRSVLLEISLNNPDAFFQRHFGLSLFVYSRNDEFNELGKIIRTIYLNNNIFQLNDWYKFREKVHSKNDHPFSIESDLFLNDITRKIDERSQMGIKSKLDHRTFLERKKNEYIIHFSPNSSKMGYSHELGHIYYNEFIRTGNSHNTIIESEIVANLFELYIVKQYNENLYPIYLKCKIIDWYLSALSYISKISYLSDPYDNYSLFLKIFKYNYSKIGISLKKYEIITMFISFIDILFSHIFYLISIFHMKNEYITEKYIFSIEKIRKLTFKNKHNFNKIMCFYKKELEEGIIDEISA